MDAVENGSLRARQWKYIGERAERELQVRITETREKFARMRMSKSGQAIKAIYKTAAFALDELLDDHWLPFTAGNPDESEIDAAHRALTSFSESGARAILHYAIYASGNSPSARDAALKLGQTLRDRVNLAVDERRGVVLVPSSDVTASAQLPPNSKPRHKRDLPYAVEAAAFVRQGMRLSEAIRLVAPTDDGSNRNEESIHRGIRETFDLLFDIRGDLIKN